jgi:dTDP-glucose 4,6-dehydratase
MKLLVTGGAGFIGSNFIHYWLKNHSDDEIVNLDSLTYAGNLENLKEAENNPKYSFVKGDICDEKVVKKAMEGVDIVVNFAAETHVDRSILGPAVFIKTNVIGTQVLLDAALEAKVVRFHHVSTDEVFGSLELDSKEKFSEDTPYKPRSPYSASKAAADHLVRAYSETYKLPITISNCSNNFGPYQFPEKVIPLFVTNLIEGKKVPLYGDGLNVREHIFVEDHCRGIELILEKGKVGETYLIGSGDEIANIDLTKKILNIMGKDDSWIERVKDRPGHDRRYAIDSSKIEKELGFKPKYSFDEALKLTVEWYKKNLAWWKKIRTGEYLRYYEQQYVKR